LWEVGQGLGKWEKISIMVNGCSDDLVMTSLGKGAGTQIKDGSLKEQRSWRWGSGGTGERAEGRNEPHS
jgi:hypothetical protein